MSINQSNGSNSYVVTRLTHNFKLIHYLGVCIISLNLYSQGESDATPTPITVPSSPDVAAFNKYGEIPISHFSGVPNISIPIYSIQEGDLNIPINLKYHAGGFKVDEMASEVGLGWSLSSGGMISRSKNGNSDEFPGGYHDVANNIDVYLINSDDSEDQLNKYDDYDQMNKISLGIWDLQPDVFSFNILGKYNGQFIIDYEGNILTMPSSKVKVIPPVLFSGPTSLSLRYGAADDEWLIITTDGNRFYFGGDFPYKEQTNQVFTETTSEEDFDSAWYLKKIISAGGQIAEYSYDSEVIDYDAVNSKTVYTPIGQLGSCYRPTQSNLSQMTVTTPKVTEIETNNYKIVFGRESRIDLSGASRLSTINIQKKTNGILGSMKFIRLYNNQYFGSQNDNKRLKLDKLRIYPNIYNQNDSLEYSFQYDESYELPESTSYDKDHWGYYNAANNTGLVPEMEYGGQLLAGADRAVNEDVSLAYLLEKIVYPTKGFTEFEYESNQYYNEEHYYDPRYEQIYVTDAPGGSLDPIESKYIQISHAQTITLDALIDYDPSVPEGDGIGAYIKIEDSNDNVVFSTGGGEEIDEVYNVPLNTGNYYLRIYNDQISGTNINARLDYKKDLGLYPKQYLVGGARVKKISSNPVDGVPIVTSFFYDPYDVILFNDPTPLSYTYELCEPYPTSPTNCECIFLVRTSSSRFFGNGQSVGYKTVHEIKGELTESQCYGEGSSPISLPYEVCESAIGSLGKTTYRYLSAGDNGNGGWPFTPRKIPTWKQGLMVQKDVVDNQNDILEHVESEYVFPVVDTVTGMVIGKVKAPSLGQFDHLQTTTEFTQIFYDYKSEPAYLSSRETMRQGVVTKEYFQYNDEFLLSEHLTITESGDTIVKKLRYASDFEGMAVDDFKNNNFIGLPIEVISLKNGVIVNSRFNKYQSIALGNVMQFALDKSYQYDLDDVFKDISIVDAGEFIIDDGYFESMRINNDLFITNGVLSPFYLASGYETSSDKKEFFRNNEGQVLAVFLNANRGQVEFINFEADLSFQSYTVISGGLSAVNFEGTRSFKGEISLSVDEPSSSSISLTLHAKSDNEVGTIEVGGVSIPITNKWRGYKVDIPWSSTGITINSNGNYVDAIAAYPIESSVQIFEHGLYGITCVTDSNGSSNHYEYDDFGRLELVRDNEGNILKRHQYTYSK